ncbi:hypothetical protein [Lutimonas zeaxanthinifaciens]|uniref:hypothetical protein n=1 Tax=Lutimonas zeaxanthinifaciens TaxID=3060215 RepID=UPI00265CFE38|nr:hypothetical protein [Lutimonas sp. YSD2104]WKK66428.1 hypothetical protein QZH61_02130 [Lutimonas sp. YSD2104]
MIQKVLTDIEIEVSNRINEEENNLKAVKELKLLLDQIDYEAEVVPFEDKERLSRLLVSLKGATLNESENQLVERISTYQI